MKSITLNSKKQSYTIDICKDTVEVYHTEFFECLNNEDGFTRTIYVEIVGKNIDDIKAKNPAGCSAIEFVGGSPTLSQRPPDELITGIYQKTANVFDITKDLESLEFIDGDEVYKYKLEPIKRSSFKIYIDDTYSVNLSAKICE